MALRDQPYIPLYVDDYLTDEKLNMCSASTQGVYIKILCILHKQTEYGKLLLKQKEKQDSNICLNFAAKFAKILPFTIDVILPAIEELIEEEILIVDGDCIYQKRMVKDNYLSLIKAKNGSKGGIKTQEKNKDFAKAKNEANTVIEYVSEIESEIDIELDLTQSSNKSNGVKNSKNSKTQIIPTDDETQMFEQARTSYLGSKAGLQTELNNFVKKYPNEWQTILPLLLPAIAREKIDKAQKLKNNNFNQQWKNFSTWINNKCWEIEYPNVTQSEVDSSLKVSTNSNGEQKTEIKEDRSSYPMYQTLKYNPELFPEGTESRCGYWVIKNKQCVKTHKC